jgi:glycosyltransferase 2 family protein
MPSELVIPLTPAVSKARPVPKRKFWRSPYFRFGGSALILTLLLTYLPHRQVWSAIKRIPPVLGLAVLCGYLTLHLLGVIKWRLLINLAGAKLRFPQAARCYYWGLFGNIFLPSLVGGDLVRGGMAFLFSRARAAIVLGSLMDRVQDVIGLLAVTAFGALLLPGSLDYHTHKTLWTIAAILAVAGAFGLALLFVVPARRFPFKIRRVMAKLRRGVRSMYRRPGRMLLCFTLGVILQVSQVGINYWLGEVAGLHIPFSVWLFAWPLAKLSALLPVTQGGIGVREAALVGLLAPFGAPPVLTAAVGLSFQAGVISGGLVGGIIALIMGRFAFAKTHHHPGAAGTHTDAAATQTGGAAALNG